MATYPHRDITCGKLHLDHTSDNHPGWQGPSDPPTGTPKNGKRAPNARAAVPANQQLITPPASQQPALPTVNPAVTREATPNTPTPGESLEVDPNTPATATAFSPAAGKFKRPELQVDTDDHLPLPPPPPSPRHISDPAHPQSTDKATQTAPSPTMFGTRGLFDTTPTTTPSGSSILVPETEQQPIPNPLNPRRPGLPQNRSNDDGSQTLSDITDLDDTTRTKTKKSRTVEARLDRLAETLHGSTALVLRHRRRAELQAAALMRERAVAAQANNARAVVEAGRDRAIAVATAESVAEAERKAARAQHLTMVVAGLVAALVVYAVWCWVNSVEFEYVREVNRRNYGL